MKTKSKSAYALKLAHAMQKSALKENTWADLVRHGWYFIRFREWMLKGVVNFTYFKKDQSLRDAYGTLDMTLVPFNERPKSSGEHQENLDTFAYYDLYEHGWRSFRYDHFVGFVTRWELKRLR